MGGAVAARVAGGGRQLGAIDGGVGRSLRAARCRPRGGARSRGLRGAAHLRDGLRVGRVPQHPRAQAPAEAARGGRGVR
eukprot:scaffold83297_cov62-Phaeocystis_antarctica.AAC.1